MEDDTGILYDGETLPRSETHIDRFLLLGMAVSTASQAQHSPEPPKGQVGVQEAGKLPASFERLPQELFERIALHVRLFLVLCSAQRLLTQHSYQTTPTWQDYAQSAAKSVAAS